MTSKTKDFQLNEEINFKNEIIHFFNIESSNSCIYIYLEIEGKRIKSENSKEKFYKLILKDIDIKNTKKDFNAFIIEGVELKISIKIITKYTRLFRKKSSTVCIKPIENEEDITDQKNVSPQLKGFTTGMSIKDRIKLFSGQLIKKHINKQFIPGRLIMPKIFQFENEIDSKKGNKKQDKEKQNKEKKK